MFRILRRCLLGLVVALPLVIAAPHAAQAQWYSTYWYPGGYRTYYYGTPYYAYRFPYYYSYRPYYPGRAYVGPRWTYRPYGYRYYGWR